MNDEEDAAVRDPIEARADRAEINFACYRILQNHGNLSLMLVAPHSTMCSYLYFNLSLGVPFAHNAQLLVQEYRLKLGRIYDMWVNLREGAQVSLEKLKNIYGNTGYAYNNEVII